MTSAAEFQAKVSKALIDMIRFEGIVNGDASTTIETDNGSVPSIATFMLQLIARIDAGVAAGSLKIVSTTTYTFIPEDSGSIISFTHPSGCTATLGLNCPAGWIVQCGQDSAGTVTIAFGTGMSNVSLTDATQSGGQGAEFAVMVRTNNGSAGTAKVTGQTA